MRTLLLLALIHAAVRGETLRSGCSADDREIGSVSDSDRVDVLSAMALGGPVCYKIVVARPGESLTGYVLGESLEAVATFVQGREMASVESAKVEARLALEAAARAKAQAQAKAAEKGTAKPIDPLVSTQFDDFAGRDAQGKLVSLSGLRGNVTVVTFWSPGSVRSISELTRVLPLYNQFHKSGLAAVGISMDPKPGRITEALDDITLPWSQMADRSGLAARYSVDRKAGKTFVLDASHRIVAAGAMGPEIFQAVQRLLAVPGVAERQ